MATADHVKALIRSHAEGDDERFYGVALQVAARAARQGQSRAAQELRELIDEAKTRVGQLAAASRRPIPLTQPRGELTGLLSVTYPETRLADLVLDETVAAQLRRVVLEHLQQERLRERGFGPLRRVLLVGPPGTGKTFSAGALAGELRLPLFTIRLDGLITKFMGETAAKLRVVFDAMAATAGVYFFDEVDALGGERGRGDDVGEIRRVLNSFLQFLEQDESPSLLLAATNHPQLLDRAMFRRFDAVIAYSMPTEDTARRVIEHRLARMKVGRISWDAVLKAAVGLSHGEIAIAAGAAAKDVILRGGESVGSKDLVEALGARRSRQ